MYENISSTHFHFPKKKKKEITFIHTPLHYVCILLLKACLNNSKDYLQKSFIKDVKRLIFKDIEHLHR